MDDETFRLLVRRARLEPLLDGFADDLRAAIEHVEDLRGALDGKVEIAQEPWPKAPPATQR